MPRKNYRALRPLFRNSVYWLMGRSANICKCCFCTKLFISYTSYIQGKTQAKKVPSSCELITTSGQVPGKQVFKEETSWCEGTARAKRGKRRQPSACGSRNCVLLSSRGSPCVSCNRQAFSILLLAFVTILFVVDVCWWMPRKRVLV